MPHIMQVYGISPKASDISIKTLCRSIYKSPAILPKPFLTPSPSHFTAKMCTGKDYTLPLFTQSAGIDLERQVKVIWPSILTHGAFMPVGQCNQAYPISSSTSSMEKEMRSTDKKHL